MKNEFILFLVVFVLVFNVNAQSYNFSVSTGNYSDLNGSISLNNGMTWDDPAFSIPIGFNFQYFNETIDHIYITEEGLGATLTTDSNQSGTLPILIPYGADIIDRGYDFDIGEAPSGSLSNISYILEGTTGSQILKLEWNNVGFYSELDENEVSNDFTNFQLWLYEETNVIEIHFGPNSINYPFLSFDGETGSNIALVPQFNFYSYEIIGNGYGLNGNPSSPNFVTINDDSFYLNFLNGIIPNGTIYKFSPAELGLSKLENIDEKLLLYPNPSINKFNVSFDGDDQEIHGVTILNMTGKVIKEIIYTKDEIDVSDLNPGVYLVKIYTSKGEIYKRFVKK